MRITDILIKKLSENELRVLSQIVLFYSFDINYCRTKKNILLIYVNYFVCDRCLYFLTQVDKYLLFIVAVNENIL